MNGYVLEDRIAPATLSLLNEGTLVRLTPGANVTNFLTISTTATQITLHDHADVFSEVPTGWALSDDDYTVTGPRGDVALIQCLDMGPENDYLDGTGSDIPLNFSGGLGDDILYGGSAADELSGGLG